MRIAFVVPILMLALSPTPARPDTADLSPAAAENRNDARWAEWEAQARITEGDYDGAIKAQRQADADRQQAAQKELLARRSKQ
jgi:hypothetical protein